MILRPHQQKAMDMIRESLICGKKRPIVAAPTSFGKTVLAGQMMKNCEEKGKIGWFFCDRVKLVDQTIEKFTQMGINFGVRQADHDLKNPHAPIQIASIQTVQAMVNNHGGKLPEFDLALVDECFLPGHEILTDSGWLEFEKLNGERVAQYSQDDLSLDFVHPEKIIAKPYEGKVVRFKSDKLIDIEVTAGHDMLLFKGGSPKKVRAEDVTMAYYHSYACAPKPAAIGRISPELALMIAYQADGSKHSKGVSTFQFSKQRKIDRFLALCKVAGIEVSETKSRPASGNTKERRRFFINLSMDKYFYRNIKISDFSQEECAAIVEEFAEWDGYRKNKNSVYFSSSDEGVVNFYQSIALLAGYKTNKTLQVDDRKRSYSDIHRLFVSKDKNSFSLGSISRSERDYKGMVYCVEVPKGNIVVRRNGKPVVTGNCHTNSELINTVMEQYNNIPIVGLTATPYSKGMGKKYNNLIVPITQRELLDQGYLCPVRYYGGQHIDLSRIASSDANTYKADDLEKETSRNKEHLTGCIIKNWFEWGERSQTIAFSPSQDHSKYLVEKFNNAGVFSEHIDCYTPQKQRDELYKAHDAGEFKILSCSRLLNTGYDAPRVRCIIDCFPIKSVTTYVQRVGRITRTSPGKEYSIYLDHADNFEKFGYAEDIVPESLHDGEAVHKETDLIKKDKKDAKKKDCPQCYQQMAGPLCRSCGYQVPITEQMVDDGSMLKEVTEGKAANKKTSMDDKTRFYSDLKLISKQKGYSDGWCSHKYKERFGVWPNKIKPYSVDSISSDTKGWIQHSNIKRAKSAAANRGVR